MILQDTLQKLLPQISDQHLLRDLAKNGTIREFKAGEAIMEAGKYIKSVPIVIEGAIKVLRPDADGNELFLYYLESGDTCALSLTCCSADLPSEVNAIAEEDTAIISIPTRLHEQWMREYSQWKEFVARTYQKRFQELLFAIDEIAFKNLDDRLLSYLIQKASRHDQPELQITHSDIARELSTSREVISRLLKKLEQQGHVELLRNRILIRASLLNQPPPSHPDNSIH